MESSSLLLDAFRTDKTPSFELRASGLGKDSDMRDAVELWIHTMRVDNSCLLMEDDFVREGLVKIGMDALHQAKTTLHTTPPKTDAEDETEVYLEAKRLISLQSICQLIPQLCSKSRHRVNAFIALLHDIAYSGNQEEEEDHAEHLSRFFAPMFARPPHTAYLSIRHSKEVIPMHIVLWVWIENAKEMNLMVQEGISSSSPRPTNNNNNNSNRVRRKSSGFAIPTPTPDIATTTTTTPVKRKSWTSTPPSITPGPKRRLVDLDTMMAHSLVLQTFFGNINSDSKNHQTTWLALESNDNVGFKSPSSSSPISSPSSSSSSKWANPERLEIEKRVLKKRLMLWDREFEHEHKRKPEREDRHQVRTVFAAYSAVKELLQAVKSQDPLIEELEKKALQAVLKLFEKDFEEKMQRKVEFSSDVAGREMEYSRYKELKQRSNAGKSHPHI